MTKLFSLGLACCLALSLTGCELYFGEDNDNNGEDWSYCAADGYYVNGEWTSATCPGGGNSCSSNDDCAAGCFCVLPEGDDGAAGGGTCEEAGFCSTDEDCAAGYHCDDRSSCVPDEVVASCNAPIDPTTCTNGAPQCPAGSVPLISEGCYADLDGNGQFDCSTIATCDTAPACAAFQHTADCEAGDACTVVTKGINCTTSTGGACQDGQAGCTCAMYVFDSCRS